MCKQCLKDMLFFRAARVSGSFCKALEGDYCCRLRSGGIPISQTPCLLFAVSQHRLFNEHLVSASSNPALAMRRKKHTEKEVHADLVSIVSVRLREGYSIREVNITKGDWEVTEGLGRGRQTDSLCMLEANAPNCRKISGRTWVFSGISSVFLHFSSLSSAPLLGALQNTNAKLNPLVQQI